MYKLNSMTYSISQVENLSGISAHSLRIWERRYTFLKPLRTSTNIRYYSDDQLKKLLNIGILQKKGHRISSIIQMSDKEVFNLVSQIVSTYDPEYEVQIRALILSMIEMDEDVFSKVFNEQVFRTGFISTITDLIYPFLTLVGGLWINDKSSPAQEHFASNLIRQKLISAIDSVPSPSKGAPGIIQFLPEGENHEIGLLLSYFIAKDLGYRVYYLGQNVPIKNIPNVVNLVKADLLFTIFQITKNSKVHGILETLQQKVDIPILVSGDKTLMDTISPNEDLIIMSNPDKFRDYLKNNLE
jgi:DNA-binding transcriptional MerR regulator